jgi:hypothetical protein
LTGEGEVKKKEVKKIENKTKTKRKVEYNCWPRLWVEMSQGGAVMQAFLTTDASRTSPFSDSLN